MSYKLLSSLFQDASLISGVPLSLFITILRRAKATSSDTGSGSQYHWTSLYIISRMASNQGDESIYAS